MKTNENRVLSSYFSGSTQIIIDEDGQKLTDEELSKFREFQVFEKRKNAIYNIMDFSQIKWLFSRRADIMSVANNEVIMRELWIFQNDKRKL